MSSIFLTVKKFFFDNFCSHYCPQCHKQIYPYDIFCEECFPTVEYENSVILIDDIAQNGDYIEIIDKSTKLYTSYYYTGKIKSIIIKAKFENEPNLWGELTKLLAFNLDNNITWDKNTIITFIPMPKNRLKDRGYNQSKIIANTLSYTLGINVKCLLTSESDVVQSSLNFDDRQKSVLHKFKIKEYKNLKPSKIILVDDICTTGATLKQCANLLYERYNCEIICCALTKSAFNV